ncbi:hypothetical protein P691DRAFT_807603 [Macrolepiota fuliginosa MF-IS2]|uniref:C2H2-type domain-containing protein n=1 Tax=Macrolepiota fuliginosa MF-IS2 TaxID=1400762 RepID=A0A9P6C4N8_9AGAR|nr:hypothetical protein P691DRAFT_807603 [Macrolepiota fuliginosa MF-IS2]
MKIGKFIRRILCLFTHGGAQSPACVNVPPAPGPMSLRNLQDGTADNTASVNFCAQVQDEDVEVLPQDTDTLNEFRPVDSRKSVLKLLDLLVGHGDEKHLGQCFSGHRIRLENYNTNLNVHVFVAQAGWSFSQEGSTNPPSQSSNSQNGHPADNSSPPTQPGRGTSGAPLQPLPTATPQPLHIPPHQQAPVGTTWLFQPPHKSSAPGVASPYQGHSGEPSGGVAVIRVNDTPGPGPQAVSEGGSDGADYQGGKRKFICESCGSLFSTKYNVERHQRSTTRHKAERQDSEGEGSFTCQRCGKKLSRPDALRRHKQRDACGKRDGSSRRGGRGGSSAIP